MDPSSQLEELKRKGQVVRRVLNTPDGKELVEVLERTFQQRMFDVDPAKMAYKVGQYELVEYLKTLARMKNHD